MSPDYRALCAELLSALEYEGYAHWVITPDVDPLCQRARAALAQPEPEPPTDDELLRLACMTNLVYDNGYGAFPSCFIEDTDTTREALSFARAVLARWGTPATDLEQLNDH
jgi:hypothetical protein